MWRGSRRGTRDLDLIAPPPEAAPLDFLSCERYLSRIGMTCGASERAAKGTNGRPRAGEGAKGREANGRGGGKGGGGKGGGSEGGVAGGGAATGDFGHQC